MGLTVPVKWLWTAAAIEVTGVTGIDQEHMEALFDMVILSIVVLVW